MTRSCPAIKWEGCLKEGIRLDNDVAQRRSEQKKRTKAQTSRKLPEAKTKIMTSMMNYYTHKRCASDAVKMRMWKPNKDESDWREVSG